MTSKRFIPLSEYHRLPQEPLSAEFYKRQLEVVCNNATLALFIMDEKQQCVYMNPAAEKLTGYSLGEVKGRILHDVIHHTHPDGSPYPLCECLIDQAFPQNNQEQGEEVFVHKDGSFYPVAYTASPIREGDGTIGTIIEVRDITQDKLDEQARQELDRAKTEFFSNVSHEFRTPLTLMLGSVEDALADESEPLSPRQRERMDMLHRNGLRLLKLVNTLLDFSRVEADRMHAVYQPTDLAQFTTDLASTFRSAIEQAGLSLRVECPALPEPMYVDRDMWEKIVLNLLSNAFKFTFQGAIAVRLWAIENHVELQIEDTGVGIPPEELPHLFKRFHRVSGTPSRTHEGSGIGLALVQELVNLHGGAIAVTSQVDRGTTFTVTLPFGRAHLPPDHVRVTPSQEVSDRLQPVSTAVRAEAFVQEALSWLPDNIPDGVPDEIISSTITTSIPPSSTRILIADDNADLRNYLKRLLGNHYQIEAVNDGLAALAAVRQSPPDLVLSDGMMPEMDGFELLRSLRSDPQTQHIPIILLSARAGEESRIEGLEAGADDYLIKPFSARELLARVEAALKLARLRQEAARREQELRADTELAQRQLAQILENMTDAFIALDRDWRITYQNAAGEDLNGKPRSEIIGKTQWEEWPASMGTNVEVQYRRAMAEQVPVHFEHHYYSPPTYDIWVEIHAYPSEEGLGIFYQNITDRKQAEAALRESEERFRTLADNIAQLAWMTDENGWIFWYNRRWFDYTGTTLKEMEGWGWQKVHHPEHIERVTEKFRNCVETGEAWEDTFPLQGKDGQYRWFLSRAIPIYDEQGEVLRWFGTNTDITERLQAEQERERLLQREQAARVEAEAANRIKDEFLAVLSHELRSPLNPILGWVRLLQTRKFDEEKTAQALATIERNAKLQTELIEDLLDVSRILRGKLSLNVEPVDLASTIWAAMETVRLSAEAKSIQIQTKLDLNIGQVSGDANRLQQAIWNLLSNAIKFTSAGGRVEIRLERIDSQAQITVSDTGKGIAANFLPCIFDYFRQEDASTTRKFGGLGLGLAIVRHLVELHGGTIEAESQGEGQGATFTLRLPLMLTQPSPAQDRGSIELSTNLNGIKILVVDDDNDSRDFVAFLLEQSGAQVTAVASAIAAVTVLKQSKQDMLISDIGMPDMDGYALMRQIRALPPEQGGQIPAIALTAYAGDMDYQQAIAAGFQNHVSKPVEPAELVARIAAIQQAH
ncbi:MAG: response regulator [Kastovskya adunca ATA6-11-RM4]|jgi:PAS domain S-box-containing protein|nr:response regulator [Kastovskya adunca ATA6-11-RM4]